MQRIAKLAGRNIRWLKSEATGVWSITIPTEHGPRTISTGETDKTKAVEHYRELKLQWINSERFQKRALAAISGTKKITVERAIIEWADSRRKFGALSDRSITTYVSTLNSFASYFKLEKEQPVLITGEQVYEWVNHSGKMSTRRARLTVLSEWFDWLIAEKYAVSNHPRSIGKIDMSKLTHEMKEKRQAPPFTDEQFRRLLDHIQLKIDEESYNLAVQVKTGENYGYSVADRLRWLRFWKTAARIGWLTGLRISDVAQLEWASVVDLAVWTQKADTRVVLEKELNTICLSIPRDDDRFCFPQAQVRYLSNPSQLSAQFTKLCRGAGLEGYSFHSLRHAHARNLQAEGKTVPEIAERLGHVSPKTTEIYL